MILTDSELQKMRKPTNYEGVFTYNAPDGYSFWSENHCYGKIIYGGAALTNYYYLKKDETDTEKNCE